MSVGLSVERAGNLLDMQRSKRLSALFDFQAFDYQAEVLDSDAKRIVWVCSRQVGKTTTASAIPADWVLTHPGEDALITAQYQETADELFRRTKDHLAELGEPGTVGIETPNTQTYELDTGSRVLSRTIGTGSGEEVGNNQRGKVPSCIIVEEASIPSRNVFDKVLRPMFATHDDFLMLLISTPRGKNGYLWEKWNEAAESDRWARYHAKTEDNPLVSDEWLQGEKAEVDELTWRQEYLGEFVETGEEYIPESLYRPAESTTALEDTEPADGPLYLAEDPARGGEDRSVYVGLDSRGSVFLMRSYATETVPKAVRRLKSLNSEHGFRRIYIDDSSGGVVDYAQQDLSNVHGIRFTTKRKAEMYRKLKTAFEDRTVTVPDPKEGEDPRRLKDQTTALTFDYTANNILRVHHPPGGHDDHPDGLALAWLAKTEAEQSANRSPVEQRENPPGSHSANRRQGSEPVALSPSKATRDLLNDSDRKVTR